MSNKENKTLSESFLKAFGVKSHQVFGDHIVYEETERQALERKSRLLEQRLKAAKNGGFGDLRKLKEERDAVMYQLSTLAEDEISEDEKAVMEAMTAVAKELEAYARKNGGIDKMDFMKAAMMMKKGQTAQLKKFVDELDTEPREKILSLMDKDADRRKEYKAAQKKMRGEEVELDEIANKFAVVSIKNGDVLGFSSDEKDANSMARNNLRKEKGKVVKLKRGISTNRASKMIGRPLEMGLAEMNEENFESAYDKAFDSKELAEKFAGAVGGIVREMSGKFYVFNKDALQEAASIELAKKVKDLDDETDEKKQEAEMDKVDPKQAKKKFKDRDDKDIDNDGDVDKSDEYLHKRRKAISKAVSKEKEETKEEVASSSEKKSELDEAKWEYKASTYMVGGNLRYDDKLEYKLSKADAEILNKYMKQAKSDAERSKVWKMFWDSKETGDTPKGPGMAIAYAKKALKEELDEAKSDYETGHKDFSSAVQHAKAVVQKRGYEIEGEDWDNNVALGPRKPSKGKTNSYHIPVQKKGKTKKEMLHMQVYNDGNRYELNMYIQ